MSEIFDFDDKIILGGMSIVVVIAILIACIFFPAHNLTSPKKKLTENSISGLPVEIERVEVYYDDNPEFAKNHLYSHGFKVLLKKPITIKGQKTKNYTFWICH